MLSEEKSFMVSTKSWMVRVKEVGSGPSSTNIVAMLEGNAARVRRVQKG